MALSEENQLDLCEILGVEPSHIEYQLSLLSTDFTAARQAKVEEAIAEWEAVRADFTNIHPNLKNFGAEIRYNDQRAAIRNKIAVWLEAPDWASKGSTTRLQRG